MYLADSRRTFVQLHIQEADPGVKHQKKDQ